MRHFGKYSKNGYRKAAFLENSIHYISYPKKGRK